MQVARILWRFIKLKHNLLTVNSVYWPPMVEWSVKSVHFIQFSRHNKLNFESIVDNRCEKPNDFLLDQENPFLKTK